MINRRGYWLRLFHGSVSYEEVTQAHSGPGPPDTTRARLDIGSHINAHAQRPGREHREHQVRWTAVILIQAPLASG